MNARAYAFALLKEICIDEGYSNLLLRNKLQSVDPKDKALVTQIVYGTLQNYRLVRYQWQSYVKKEPCKEVALLLDMSVYQLLYMDKMPAYAVIDEAVRITKKNIHPRFSALVNAVLRQVERNGKRELEGNAIEQLALETSHPTWLVAMWKAQYGWQECEKICHSDLEIRKQCVRVNTMKASVEELLASGEFAKGSLAEDALYYLGNDIIHSNYYKQGLISIQDEVSQLVAQYVDPQPQERILDVCSAPGTKACHIAERMGDKGSIVCGDIHAHRVELIKNGARRLQLQSIQAQVMDATSLKEIEGVMFDRVLCDVPCSGYGVLARKSDIKYHAKSTDMDTLIPLQQQILQSASKHVVKDGILVYSTCTLNKKENEKQVAAFLAQHEEFECLQQQTIFPYTHHSDGFYIAKLKRVR